MSGNIYVVVGAEGSGHGTVALDLAGAFAAAGDRTVLVELDRDGTSALDRLDIGPTAVLQGTASEVLAGETNPVAAVTRVAVEGVDCEPFGILPSDGDAEPPLPLDGLGDALAALGEDHDAVVLDVGSDGVGDPVPPVDDVDGAVVTAGPDAETARTASRLAERLTEGGIDVVGAVVTGVEDESGLWRAKSRMATEVVSVRPPIRPDRVEVLGDRIATVRDELFDGDGAPVEESDRPIRSVAALVAGPTTRATVRGGADVGTAAEGSVGGETAAGLDDDPGSETEDPAEVVTDDGSVAEADDRTVIEDGSEVIAEADERATAEADSGPTVGSEEEDTGEVGSVGSDGPESGEGEGGPENWTTVDGGSTAESGADADDHEGNGGDSRVDGGSTAESGADGGSAEESEPDPGGDAEDSDGDDPWTAVPTDPERGTDGDEGETSGSGGEGDATFQFGELPGNDGSESDPAETESGESDTADPDDGVTELLDDGDEERSPDWEPPGDQE